MTSAPIYRGGILYVVLLRQPSKVGIITVIRQTIKLSPREANGVVQSQTARLVANWASRPFLFPTSTHLYTRPAAASYNPQAKAACLVGPVS